MAFRVSPSSRPIRPPLPRRQEQPPPSRTDVATNLAQSLGEARRALTKAFSELTVAQKRRVTRGGATTVPQLKETTEFIAQATSPKITFATTSTGQLQTASPITTARHEFGHFLTDLPGETEHLIFRAAGTTLAPARARLVPALGRMPQNLRLVTLGKLSKVRPGRLPGEESVGLRLGRQTGFQGFQTKQLAKVGTTGTSEQRSRARQQMIKLGRRLRARGVDF